MGTFKPSDELKYGMLGGLGTVIPILALFRFLLMEHSNVRSSRPEEL